MVEDDFVEWLKSEMLKHFNEKLDEYECPDCHILPVISDNGKCFCPVCGKLTKELD